MTNKSFVLAQAVNIPQLVGANTAYVGFTGSTGGLSASQKILYWTYATQTAGLSLPRQCSRRKGEITQHRRALRLSSATPGAVIYYTTNGTAPTTSSFVYTSPIVPGTGTTTIEAMAVASGLSQSTVVNGHIRCCAAGDGGTDLQPSGRYIRDGTKCDAERQHRRRGDLLHDKWDDADDLLLRVYGSHRRGHGHDDDSGDGGCERIVAERGGGGDVCGWAGGNGVAEFQSAAGTYATAQSVTLSDSTAGAVIYYTTNGTTPTTSSAVYATPIPVTTSETIQAIAVAPNAQASAVVTAAYVIQTGTPSINFGSGSHRWRD